MGYQLQASAQGYDLGQLKREWTMAQARIDALAEAGTQEIRRLLQDALARAERADATLDQRADVHAKPDPCRYDIDHLAEAV
jgi:hypothetical protein